MKLFEKKILYILVRLRRDELMVVKNTQHYIHNPQAFLENSYVKSCNNAMLAQFIGSGVSNLTSIFMCKAAERASGAGTTKKSEKEADVKTESPKEEKDVVAEEKPEIIETDEDIKKNIAEYLKDTGITPDEVSMDAIVKKYKNIKSFAKDNKLELTEEKLKERIILFARGLEYRKATTSFDSGSTGAIEIAGVKEAIAEGSQEQYNQAVKNHAASVIELYDENGDGALNRTEFIASQLQAAGEEANDDNMAATEVIFRVLDQDGNGKIDLTEMSALQWATSKRLDSNESKTGNDITTQEYSMVKDDMANIALSALTSSESEEILNLLQDNKRSEALAKIVTNENLTSEQKQQINDFINLYNSGYQGLLK